MRRAMMVLAAVAMLMVGTVARAQLVDPSTGIMVDAASDPMDFSAVASGQPGNIGMEAAAQANEQMQAQIAAQTAQSNQDFQNSLNDTSASDDASIDSSAPATPDWPTTPKPTLAPNGGKAATVAIADVDPNALLFYTTDGTTPTEASEKYTGPFVVSAKEKVEVLAFDLNDKPSGVVSKTFEVKK